MALLQGSQEMTKFLPIGIENFRDIIRKDCYYVDKTSCIKTVMTPGSKVLLITRPRRFGKTLFMDMLRCFLQINREHPGEADVNRALFAGLKVSEDREFCERHMGQFPVIPLSLKDVAGGTFQSACSKLADTLAGVMRHYALLAESPRLDEDEKALVRLCLKQGYLAAPEHHEDLENCLKRLTNWLARHFERQVVVLIDEYDVPLAKAMQGGYYDKMLELIRALLSPVLKEEPLYGADDSACLMKAVLTGCLRVSKESIFTGINNPTINTVCSENLPLSEVIGFNPSEVQALLSSCGLSARGDDVRTWYDGYRFAGREIYCPWDVINFCSEAMQSPDPMTYQPENFWDGTGSSTAIEEFLGFLADDDTDRMQTLVDGGAVEIEIEINEKLTYSDFVRHSAADFWTLLLFSGYLTVVKRIALNRYLVRIPNEEIRDTFIRRVKERFSQENADFAAHGREFVKAATTGDIDGMMEVLLPLLKNFVSIRDSASKSPAENYYHGMMVSLLYCAGGIVRSFDSNAEAGEGYADLCFTSGAGSNRTGVVIELKRCDKPEDLFEVADDALRQIARNHYADRLDRLRCRRQFVYGLAFCRKECEIIGEERQADQRGLC